MNYKKFFSFENIFWMKHLTSIICPEDSLLKTKAKRYTRTYHKNTTFWIFFLISYSFLNNNACSLGDIMAWDDIPRNPHSLYFAFVLWLADIITSLAFTY